MLTFGNFKTSQGVHWQCLLSSMKLLVMRDRRHLKYWNIKGRAISDPARINILYYFCICYGVSLSHFTLVFCQSIVPVISFIRERRRCKSLPLAAIGEVTITSLLTSLRFHLLLARLRWLHPLWRHDFLLNDGVLGYSPGHQVVGDDQRAIVSAA